MRHLSAIATTVLASLSFACAAQAPATDALTASECEVWQRELSFARSVAEKDRAAFAGHLHPQAAFNAGAARPLRGKDAIATAWGDIVDGTRLRLAWYPDRVTIGGVGDVAWSSGPALFERLDQQGPERFSVGKFHSVWHRDGNGAWHVLFDEGAGRAPASPEQVAAFHAGRRTECPRG